MKNTVSIPDTKWFTDAKFGMFIHWGLYSVLGGTWKGLDTTLVSEWIMKNMKISVKEYESVAKKFNPAKFNAKEWVKIAKEAGMKYMVITSKHHDGFAMFHSKYDRYNIVDATPFKRDPLKELAEECRKADIKLGFYYSQDQDWHEPGGSGNDWNFTKGSTVKKIAGDIIWPREWTIFGPFTGVSPKPDKSLLQKIPHELLLGSKTLKAQTKKTVNGILDFSDILSSLPVAGEGMTYSFSIVDAKEDSEVTLGVGADWFTELYIDGESVFSTMEKGNGEYPISLTNHVFNVKMQKGKHVFVFSFKSGLASSILIAGGPDELKKAGWRPVPGPTESEAFADYLETKVKTQLKELLTNYGPVALIWFDTPLIITPEQSKALKTLVHSIQPDCLVSGRVGHDIGDYGSLGDNQLPACTLRGVWEGIGTMNESWGFKTADNEWKSSEQLLRIMSELASKNANYLLNIGPSAEGLIPPESIKTLRKMGKWLKFNGDAVYGAGPNPIKMRRPALWGYITHTQNLLNLIVFQYPKAEITLYGLRNKIKKVYISSGKNIPLKFIQEHKKTYDYHKLLIEMQSKKKAKCPFVIKVEFNGTIDVNNESYTI